MAIVFSMQGWGYLLAPLVVLFFIGVGVPLDLVWRLTLGFGALPGSLRTLFQFIPIMKPMLT